MEVVGEVCGFEGLFVDCGYCILWVEVVYVDCGVVVVDVWYLYVWDVLDGFGDVFVWEFVEIFGRNVIEYVYVLVFGL